MPSIKPSSDMDFHRTPRGSVRPSAMNHLDRGGPSRRQTLNISPVGSPKSIPVHVSTFNLFFSALCFGSLGFWVSKKQNVRSKVLRFEVKSGRMTGESQAEKREKGRHTLKLTVTFKAFNFSCYREIKNKNKLS